MRNNQLSALFITCDRQLVLSLGTINRSESLYPFIIGNYVFIKYEAPHAPL